MPKISLIPSDASPTTAYRVVGVNAAGSPTTVDLSLATLITLFWTLANIPSGGTNPITRDNESQFAFVASGMVWSGDAYASTRNASMTAGVVYINGRRISISAVVARTFTASKDTYVDVLDNGDGTGTLVYTEVTNNVASPALAANSIRIAIIVTGATTIAAAGSVNQGQETKILPIASNIAYSVTDSLGNLICPFDPSHKLIGYRQITSNFTTSTAGSAVDITGVNVPVIIPSGRKVYGVVTSGEVRSSQAAGNGIYAFINDVTAAASIGFSHNDIPGISYAQNLSFSSVPYTPPASGARSFKLQGKQDAAGTLTYNASSTNPVGLAIYLV